MFGIVVKVKWLSEWEGEGGLVWSVVVVVMVVACAGVWVAMLGRK